LALLLALWSTWPVGCGALGLGPLRLPHDPAYGDEQRAPVHGTLALLEVQGRAPWLGPAAWRSELLAAPFGQDLLWRDHQYLPTRLLAPLSERLGAERAFGLGLLLSAFGAAAGALFLARSLGLAPAALRGGLSSLARGPNPWLPWILLSGVAGMAAGWRPWLQGLLLAGAWLSGWGFGLVASLGLLAVNLLPGPRLGLPGPKCFGPRPLCLLGALTLASVLGWPFFGALTKQRLDDPPGMPAGAAGTAAARAAPAGRDAGLRRDPGLASTPRGSTLPATPATPATSAAPAALTLGWLERLQAPELSPLRRARGQGFEPFEPAPGRPPPSAPQWSWVLLFSGALGVLVASLARWAAAALALCSAALFALWLAARSLYGFGQPFDPLHPWPALEALLRGASATAGSPLGALDGGGFDQAFLFLLALAGAAAVDAGLRSGPQARLLAWTAPMLLALELWAQPLPSFAPLPLPPLAASDGPPGALLHLPVEPRTRPIDVALARAGQPQTLPLFLDAAAPELWRFAHGAPALLAWIGSGRFEAPELVAIELDLLAIGRLWLDLEAARAPWTAAFVDAADRLPGWVRETDQAGFARWHRARAFFEPPARASAAR
jgi:hypothetical protein